MGTRIVTFICSIGYVGFLPLIPGTFGTLAGLGIYWFLRHNLSLYLAVTAVVVIAGFCFSGKVEQMLMRKDPRQIVIDEVAGLLLSFMFLPDRSSPVVLFLAFILFRVFDAVKPPPADVIQKARGSVGIMFDDVLAAVYTNGILQLVLRLAA